MTAEHDTLPLALSLTVHELRTPLSVVLGFLRLINKDPGGALSDQQRKWLELAEGSAARMNDLLDEIREVRRFEAGEATLARKPLDLLTLFKELAADMHEGHDRNVRLAVRGADRPLTVVGDRARLATVGRVLLHVVMRERVDTTVVAQCDVEEGAQPMARVIISDESRVQELAAASSTALVGEWKHGTGFSVPLARRIVDAHGGTLSSAPGDHPEQPRGGVTLRLPLTAT